MAVRRGYFAIGIYGAKNAVNVGGLWRSAASMGAAYIFTVGRRYREQASDTAKAFRHIPLFEYATFDEMRAQMPRGCLLIGVEQTDSSTDVSAFTHPDRAIYLLGAEDSGLPKGVAERCSRLIEIPSLRCLNVAVAGSIIMYDRNAKRQTPIVRIA